MRRRLFTIFSVVSLVLWLAVAVLFVRSFWNDDHLMYMHGWVWDAKSGRAEWKEIVIGSLAGRVEYNTYHTITMDRKDIAEQAAEVKAGRYDRWIYGHNELYTRERRLWIKPTYQSGVFGSSYPWTTISMAYRTIAVPDWMILLGLGVLPGVWMVKFVVGYVRLARGRVGMCGVCGYDLRATPERCPECGTAAGEKERSRDLQRGSVSVH